jgi:DNA-binding NarL/FixJ family response regulator
VQTEPNDHDGEDRKYSTREIAATLGISAKTVDRHRTNTLAKLGLRDRLALTRYAIRAGLIEP